VTITTGVAVILGLAPRTFRRVVIGAHPIMSAFLVNGRLRAAPRHG
jgi:hypothetical protein